MDKLEFFLFSLGHLSIKVDPSVNRTGNGVSASFVSKSIIPLVGWFRAVGYINEDTITQYQPKGNANDVPDLLVIS